MQSVGRAQGEIKPADIDIGEPLIRGININGRTCYRAPHVEIIEPGRCIGTVKQPYAH